MTKPFPKFVAHEQGYCFNCGGDFGDRCWWSKSGHAKGRGEFMQSCEKCGMSTWYDLTPDPVISAVHNFFCNPE